jgi:outer membrane protein OmpA-like peptidoglycan-associated protein
MSMRFWGMLSCIVMIAFAVTAAAVPSARAYGASDPNDAEGCKDPAIFTRMPGYHIYRCEEKQFDRYEVPVTSDYKTQAVEGRCLFIVYYPNEGIQQPSGLQIIRNYSNAAAAIGGKKVVQFDDGGVEHITLKIVRDNAEIWAHVEGYGSQYSIRMVERQLMKQDVAADASSLASSIRETGKASVYGIYFDSGKWDIKPESEPALQEIAKMLKADPKLKLYVVGHTDNVGAFDANVKLSNSRADAVVKALVGRHAIAASRLQPFGAGPTSPVKSNQTEEGRAKNRRVELVAQ